MPLFSPFSSLYIAKIQFSALVGDFFLVSEWRCAGEGVPHNYDFWHFFSLNSVKHIWELELWNFTKVSSRSQLLFLHVELTTEILGEDVIYERRK